MNKDTMISVLRENFNPDEARIHSEIARKMEDMMSQGILVDSIFLPREFKGGKAEYRRLCLYYALKGWDLHFIKENKPENEWRLEFKDEAVKAELFTKYSPY